MRTIEEIAKSIEEQQKKELSLGRRAYFDICDFSQSSVSHLWDELNFLQEKTYVKNSDSSSKGWEVIFKIILNKISEIGNLGKLGMSVHDDYDNAMDKFYCKHCYQEPLKTLSFVREQLFDLIPEYTEYLNETYGDIKNKEGLLDTLNSNSKTKGQKT